MFTILVGRPGTGKGSALNPAMDIVTEANGVNILSDHLTIEYILERMAKGIQQTNVQGQTISVVNDHSVFVYAEEVNVLVRRNSEALPDLSRLWDSKDTPFQYGTRHSGAFIIPNSCISLLGGTSPAWLNRALPVDAAEGGFTRRVNFVYSNKQVTKNPWPDQKAKTSLYQDLVEDLKDIAQCCGEMTLETVARPLFEKYFQEDDVQDYDDEATAAFKTSKWAHAMKLAMTLACSDNTHPIIKKQHLEQGIDEIEKLVKDLSVVFRGTGESDLVSVADKILTFLDERGFATDKQLIRVLWRHAQEEDVRRVLSTLKAGGLVVETQHSGKMVYQSVPYQQTQGATP